VNAIHDDVGDSALIDVVVRRYPTIEVAAIAANPNVHGFVEGEFVTWFL